MITWQDILKRVASDPSYRTLFGILEDYGDRVAGEFTPVPGGETVIRTYKENAVLARKGAGNLQRSILINKGDVIGLAADTDINWTVLFWSIMMSGGIPLLLNPQAAPQTLSKLLKESGAKCYISNELIQDADRPMIPVKAVLLDGPEGKEVWSDEAALCTSGTTGDSRIFIYDGRAISSQLTNTGEIIPQNDDIAYDEDKGELKQLAFLPFYHIFGFIVLNIWYSCLGKTIVYLRDRDPNTIFETSIKHGVTHICAVPVFFNSIANSLVRKIRAQYKEKAEPILSLIMSGRGQDHPMIREIRNSLLGSRIRFLISGGGHIPQDTLKIINGIGYPLYNGFGMTESGITSVELDPDITEREKGSVGRPFSSVTYTVLENGELSIKGSSLHSSRLVDGKKVIRDPESWFATGDIARLDDGKLYIEGRIKDVIINSSGENIYPDELEESFEDVEGIARLCVTGVKNGEYEDVVLVVEPQEKTPDAISGLEESISRVNQELPTYRQIRRVIFAADPLPLSGSMKVRRQIIRQMLNEGSFKELTVSDDTQEADVPARSEGFEADPRFKGILDDILQIFADTLSIEKSSVSDRAHFIFDLGGDSLSIIGIMAQLEEKYGLVISDSELSSAINAYEIAKIIYGKKYGIDLSGGTSETHIGTSRITDFRDSEEYKALEERKANVVKDQSMNPYFVPHDSLIRDTSIINGSKVINLGSYNYLGMSGNPETMEAAIEAIKIYGTSASGSRTLAGEKTLYQKLEKTIADWKHTEDSIVCTGGWSTNLTFISCFAKKGDFILYDALSHNSITEGVALSKADSKAFTHNDLNALEATLKNIEGKYNKVLIVVEGVYSMDGDIAPIPEFVKLKKRYGCFLMVDEAHSSGVIGDHGGGVDDYFHLEPHDVDIKMGTLSKALGTCGGYIAADRSIVEYLRYSMNGFVFTAGISPPLAAACMKAIEIIQRDNTTVSALHRNIEYFIRRANEEGLNTGLAKESAIVPVLVGSDEDAAMLSHFMLKNGVFVPPAMYPAVPRGQSRLRFSLSAAHSIEQLETAVSLCSRLMREYGFIK